MNDQQTKIKNGGAWGNYPFAHISDSLFVVCVYVPIWKLFKIEKTIIFICQQSYEMRNISKWKINEILEKKCLFVLSQTYGSTKMIDFLVCFSLTLSCGFLSRSLFPSHTFASWSSRTTMKWIYHITLKCINNVWRPFANKTITLMGSLRWFDGPQNANLLFYEIVWRRNGQQNNLIKSKIWSKHKEILKK